MFPICSLARAAYEVYKSAELQLEAGELAKTSNSKLEGESQIKCISVFIIIKGSNYKKISSFPSELPDPKLMNVHCLTTDFPVAFATRKKCVSG